jgi:hypothetical protein
MGKVSLFLIFIGLVFLLPAIVLTIIPVIFPAFIPNPSRIEYDWLGIVRIFVMGLLYVLAFGFIVLGLIIVKRDSE